MRKIETFDSGRWKAFFRCSNELCKAWFSYKVIETFYDETLIQGTENKTKWQKIFHSEKYTGTVKRKRCKKCRNEILVRELNNSHDGGGGFHGGF
jgi:hypothetical protein